MLANYANILAVLNAVSIASMVAGLMSIAVAPSFITFVRVSG